MRWALKSNFLFIVTVAIPSLIGLLAIFTLPSVLSSNSQKSSADLIPARNIFFISCFDLEKLQVSFINQSQCPENLLSLGDGALIKSDPATVLVGDIHPLLRQRFVVASAFARSEGIKLEITSGFRSLERQQFLFAREVARRGSQREAAKWVLPPRDSHHPQGLAIDINYPNDRVAAKWLDINGWRFGLCRVYANEWWHFEAVSAPGEACPIPAPNAIVDFTTNP